MPLTAELNPYKVLESKVFQEDSWGSSGFEVEGYVHAQSGLEAGEVQVGRLLVEGCCIPQWSCVEIVDMSHNIHDDCRTVHPFLGTIIPHQGAVPRMLFIFLGKWSSSLGTCMSNISQPPHPSLPCLFHYQDLVHNNHFAIIILYKKALQIFCCNVIPLVVWAKQRLTALTDILRGELRFISHTDAASYHCIGLCFGWWFICTTVVVCTAMA